MISAVGGSTNGVIHLLALAREAQVKPLTRQALEGGKGAAFVGGKSEGGATT